MPTVCRDGLEKRKNMGGLDTETDIAVQNQLVLLTPIRFSESQVAISLRALVQSPFPGFVISVAHSATCIESQLQLNPADAMTRGSTTTVKAHEQSRREERRASFTCQVVTPLMKGGDTLSPNIHAEHMLDIGRSILYLQYALFYW